MGTFGGRGFAVKGRTGFNRIRGDRLSAVKVAALRRQVAVLKKQNETMRRCLEFMDVVRRISSRFVSAFEIDGAIDASLADIGRLSGAGRAYLFLFDWERFVMDNTHEWCAPGVSPQIQNLQNLPLDMFPWWMDKLKKGEVIHITDVSRLPPEANNEREILESQDIKSLLVLPLYIRGGLSGFIGFDNVKNTGAWGKEDLALLRVAAEITGGALERKMAQEALLASEAVYRTVFENSGTAMAVMEEDGTLSRVNSEFEKLTGYTKEEVEGVKKWADFGGGRDIIWGGPAHSESRLLGKDGGVKIALVSAAFLPGTNKKVVSLLDLTERKRMEEELKYLAFHDSLTGLYNRAYFEEELRRLDDGRHLPVGIIVCDVDGLKAVNDTLGHRAGDRLLADAAGILKGCFRKSDVVARVGGDEFAVVLPRCGVQALERICSKIKEAFAGYNATNPELAVSLSIGFAVKDEPGISLEEVFRRADTSMYREKLHHSESARSAVVQALTKALAARDFITGGHAERLERLVVGLARAAGVPELRLADLKLLAQFHDIGKVGIPDRILFKPGPFDEVERAEMQQHSLLGYRMALTVPDLAPIADWILKHHEWWDGRGYPLGIKGEEIPLECRILAIADAYDAMTSDRPYRQAVSREEALSELKRCAGTQFDPHLVAKFVEMVEKESF